MSATGLGVLAALGASLAYNGAIIVQGGRASAISPEEASGVRLLLRLLRDRVWLGGMLLDGLGLGLHTLAMLLAPITAVQPALAVGLLLPLFVGAHAGGGTPHRREILGVAAVIAGVAVLGLVAPEREPSAAGAADLALALGLLTALVAVSAALTYLPAFGAVRASAAAMVCSGAAYALSAVLLKLATDELVAGAVLAALAWGMGVLVVDVVGFNQEMGALQRRPASQVSAFVFAVPAILPVVISPFVFGERWGDTPGGGALLAAALVVAVAGAVALAGSPLVTAAKPADHGGVAQ